MKEIKLFKFSYIPWNKEYPINNIDIYIVAENRKEAELINLQYNYKFFEQDCHVIVTEELQGYKQK